MASLELDGCALRVLAVVRGLDSEVPKVRDAFDRARPELVAISISKEDLDFLTRFSGEPKEAEPFNFEEEVYIRELRRFGEVKKPPPCYVAAVRLARERALGCEAIDLDEAEFTNAYCRSVSTFELYRHSWSAGRFTRRRFKASSPEEFALEFDRAATRIKGFRLLEDERERHMTERLRSLSKGRKSVLAVLELERAAGVERLLGKVGV